VENEGPGARESEAHALRDHLYARVLKRRQQLWTLTAEARVDGEVATEAELSAALVDREG
jgi:3-hydroxymyristoyl/3-hydroxydecanoyl-(acyl carrier protein) dehydratase